MTARQRLGAAHPAAGSDSGLERGPDGKLVGRDPRQMTAEELLALGHSPTPPLKALRARCLDCCSEISTEVRYCPATQCPSWPFRMGTNPYRKPVSAARRELSRAVLSKILRKDSKSVKLTTSESEPRPAAP